MKFQLVNMKLLEGVARESKRPYKMLICSGIYTNADGTMEVGEITFMEGQNRPLPSGLKPGEAYTPTIGARARDGKLSFEITELKPVASVRAAA